MQVVTGNRTIPYDVRGSGHRTLLLLPALGADGTMWRPQLEHFSRYTVISAGTGGHDNTGSSSQRSLADYASDAISILDAVGISRADVVGLSMGGMVAQEAGMLYPDRVRSLVLVSTAGSYPAENREALESRASTAEREGMAPVAEVAVQRWFSPGFRQSGDPWLRTIRDMLLTADPSSYAEAARAVAAVHTLDRLQQISAPTLILSGELDESLPPGAAVELAGRIPGAVTDVLLGASHLCNIEAADRFNATVAGFLAEASESGRDDDTDIQSPW